MNEKKRQTLIISWVVLALVGLGGYEFFERSRRREAKDQPAGMDSKQMLVLANQATAATPESERAARVFTLISAAWDEGPFVHGKYIIDEHIEKPVEIEVAFDAKEFDYSGFLQAGEEAIAIVNGIDYKTGEVVKDFTIEKITPDAVTLSKLGKKFEVRMR